MRYRWWYRMTGLPGWMRFGFSPGWAGRGPYGLGPGAYYLMHGLWPTPQMNYAWRRGDVPFPQPSGFPMPGFPTPYDPWGATKVAPEQELEILKGEAEMLEEELERIKKRIDELEKER
ncbi:MAG: hypothetical protein AB1502_01815 [Thermodesulfobacteriota bacterium]